MQMHIPTDHERRLKDLVRVFLEENAKINLSAHRTEERVWNGNVLDSLAMLEVIPLLHCATLQMKILDVGTGGGFPLLPLAICMEGTQLTGMDSTTKKIEAVRRITKALGVKNVDLVNGRAEALGHESNLREKCDVVTARAVADISVLLELCAPFAKVGGSVVLWKSLQIDEELRSAMPAMEELHCQLITMHHYTLPDPFGERQLLIFKKTDQTPNKYPRSPSIIKNHPL